MDTYLRAPHPPIGQPGMDTYLRAPHPPTGQHGISLARAAVVLQQANLTCYCLLLSVSWVTHTAEPGVARTHAAACC